MKVKCCPVSLSSLTETFLFIWLFVILVMNLPLETLQSRSIQCPKGTKKPLKTAPLDKMDLNSIKMFQSFCIWLNGNGVRMQNLS